MSGSPSAFATMSHLSLSIQSGPPVIWYRCNWWTFRIRLNSELFVTVTRPPGSARTDALLLPETLRLIDATSNAGLASRCLGVEGELPQTAETARMPAERVRCARTCDFILPDTRGS